MPRKATTAGRSAADDVDVDLEPQLPGDQLADAGDVEAQPERLPVDGAAGPDDHPVARRPTTYVAVSATGRVTPRRVSRPSMSAPDSVHSTRLLS